MLILLLAVLNTARCSFKSRHQLELENLALRQQLAMLKRSVKRPRVSVADRLLIQKYVRSSDKCSRLMLAGAPLESTGNF